jgi:predicted AlkP superfamily pyrophosphatase or phosphodiesterase
MNYVRFRVLGLRFRTVRVFFLLAVFTAAMGCSHLAKPPAAGGPNSDRSTKLFVIVLDALRRNLLMDSLDALPNFSALIKGVQNDNSYIGFENVLVSVPSSSKPSNTTLLTGVYPDRHGVPATIWFDRKDEKIKTLTSLSQRGVVEILKQTQTDTLFDYARRSKKTTMAVASLVAKGVDRWDWIQQSVHIWGQAYCLNLFQDANPIPDGAHLDRRTTKGLMKGYLYSLSDGLEGKLRRGGKIPDLTVVHFVGLDIFTHYPRRFMLKGHWSIDAIQKWYLQEVLDPELGKIIDFLKQQHVFDNTIFFFISDHGQSKIKHHIDENAFVKGLKNHFKIKGHPYALDQAEVLIMPGASSKTLYLRNRQQAGWMAPPRLIEDVKPVVDALIDIPEMEANLNAVLIARYPGEREDAGVKWDPSGALDPFWFFNPGRYHRSSRSQADFLAALEPLSRLDDWVGRDLKAAYMYGRDFTRRNRPDIILINRPGAYFTPDQGKYAHHGSVYEQDALVSFVICGPALDRFCQLRRTLSTSIDSVDFVPMAAHLAGISIDKPIDGKDRLMELLR